MKDFEPNVLSDVLLTEYILKKEEKDQFNIDSRWNTSEYFGNYVKCYKIAIVLLALLQVEKKNKNFHYVRRTFERAVYYDGNIKKQYFYDQIKIVMKKLLELLDISNYKIDKLEEQNEKMPWTMACLRSMQVLKNNQAIMPSGSSVIGMGWAMAWLKEVGIIEKNPVTLARFSLMWMDNYLAINNFLNECNPIVNSNIEK